MLGTIYFCYLIFLNSSVSLSSSYVPEHINNGSSKENVASRLSHSPFLKITLYFENSSYSSHASAGLRLILKVGFGFAG